MKSKKKKNKQDSTDEQVTQELKDRRNDEAMADWRIDYDELDPVQKRIVNRRLEVKSDRYHLEFIERSSSVIDKLRKKNRKIIDRLRENDAAGGASRKKSKKVESIRTKLDIKEGKRITREERAEAEEQKKQTISRLLQTTTKFFGMDRGEIKQSHAGRELTRGDWYKIFNSIRRRAWAFGYDEQQIMITVGKILLCKLYDEEYANSCIFEKITHILESRQMHVELYKNAWELAEPDVYDTESHSLFKEICLFDKKNFSAEKGFSVSDVKELEEKLQSSIPDFTSIFADIENLRDSYPNTDEGDITELSNRHADALIHSIIQNLLECFWDKIYDKIFAGEEIDEILVTETKGKPGMLEKIDMSNTALISLCVLLTQRKISKSNTRLVLALDYANIASPLLDDRWTALLATTHFMFDLLNPKNGDTVYIPSSDTGIPLLLFGQLERKSGSGELKEINTNFGIITNSTSQYNRIISMFSLLLGGRKIQTNIDDFAINPRAKELRGKIQSARADPPHDYREDVASGLMPDVLVFDPFNFFLNAIRNLPNIENVLSDLLRMGQKIVIPMPDTILRSQSELTKQIRSRIMKKCRVRAIFYFPENYLRPITPVSPVVLLLENRDSAPKPIFVGIQTAVPHANFRSEMFYGRVPRLQAELLRDFEKFNLNKLHENDNAFTITEKELEVNWNVLYYMPSRKEVTSLVDVNQDNQIQLSEITDVIGGKQHNMREKGRIPYVRIGNYQKTGIFNAKSSFSFVKPTVTRSTDRIRINDILFSNTGTVGKTAIVRKSFGWIEGGVVAPQIFILRVKSTQVNPSYLYHMISKSQFIKYQISNFTRGSTIPRISKSDLENIIVSLPDLKTQQKTVNNIEKLETERDQLQQRMDEINEIVEGEITRMKNIV